MTIVENTSATLKSHLNPFTLFCKSQRHLTDTKICFSSYTESLVVANLQPPGSARTARQDHPPSPAPRGHVRAPGAGLWKRAAAKSQGKPGHTCHGGITVKGCRSCFKSLPVSAHLSGLLSSKAPKQQMQHSFKSKPKS